MYDYQKEKKAIFTEEGQVQFLGVRDDVRDMLNGSGAVRMLEIIHHAVGDSWFIMACVDRLVELGELHEVLQDNIPAQHRVFVK